MDLADVARNVKDGCHIASMGGFWMTLVYGFAGLRDNGGLLRFTPRVPEQVGSLKFSLQIQAHRLEVNVSQKSATYLVRGDDPFTLQHEGEQIELAPDIAVTRPVTLPTAGDDQTN